MKNMRKGNIITSKSKIIDVSGRSNIEVIKVTKEERKRLNNQQKRRTQKLLEKIEEKSQMLQDVM